jgi:hypothetical protein
MQFYSEDVFAGNEFQSAILRLAVYNSIDESGALIIGRRRRAAQVAGDQ